MTTKHAENRTQDAARRPTSAAHPGRTKLQRSPLLIVVAALILISGGGLGWFLWASSSRSVEVVAAGADVERGQVITADDLVTVRVTLDPALKTVPATDLRDLVGQRAATDLTAGTLVSPDQVTSAALPPAGMSVVAVPIASGLVPTVPIRAGDIVRFVQTPGPAEDTAGNPATITAEVVDLSVADATTIVTVLVPADRAGDLAALAATGRVAIVLDSRGG